MKTFNYYEYSSKRFDRSVSDPAAVPAQFPAAEIGGDLAMML